MKQVLLILILLLTLVGCEEQTKQPAAQTQVVEQAQDPLTANQIAQIEKWGQTVEGRFKFAGNAFNYLFQNMPDPNEIRDLKLQVEDIDCRLEELE